MNQFCQKMVGLGMLTIWQKNSCYMPETNEAEVIESSVLFATQFLKWHNDCLIPTRARTLARTLARGPLPNPNPHLTRDGASPPNAHDCALATRLHKRGYQGATAP
jgi:hypothetical protein